tara:strand:+ start:1129 stop:1743 length:615 start_codon:yes stop_codon:yes gene_type:complete
MRMIAFLEHQAKGTTQEAITRRMNCRYIVYAEIVTDLFLVVSGHFPDAPPGPCFVGLTVSAQPPQPLTRQPGVWETIWSMTSSASKFRAAFSLTAALLVLIAAPLAWVPSAFCQCGISTHDDACCGDAKDCTPCECPAYECHRATTIVASVDTSEQRLTQNDLLFAWADATELPVANNLADASSHAPPPVTALQCCVLLARLTL